MPTFTSKLGLQKDLGTELYDVDVVNDNLDKIDNAMGAVICTSTTRPSTNLFNGMELYETDTRRSVVRVAGAWVDLPTHQTISSAANRNAITTPYDGQPIYRSDYDATEIYDGAAWRTQGIPFFSSEGSRDTFITSPYNGQLAFTTDTSTMWIRSGGAWARLWKAQLAAQLKALSVQSIPNGAFTDINLSGEDIDSHNGHSTVTNNHLYTCPRTDRLLVSGGVSLSADPTGARGLRLLKNSAEVDGTQTLIKANDSAGLSTIYPLRATIVDVGVGDTLKIQAYHNRGSALDTLVSGSGTSTLTIMSLLS